MNKKAKVLVTLFYVFMKVGLFTIGGGYAMIPLVQRETAEKYKLVDQSEIVDILAISGSMPGSIAINLATFIGYKSAGFLGAVVSTVGMVLPSFLIICIISLFFRQFSDLEVIKFAFEGMRVGVVALIFKAALSVFKQAPKGFISYLIIPLSLILVLFDLVNAAMVIVIAAAIGIIYALIAKQVTEMKSRR